STNDGFKIAEKDLEMRGPGDIEGTRQSGMLDLKVADIVKDTRIFEVARAEAMDILETDPELSAEDHGVLRQYLARQKGKTPWSRIS
ncbi:MAG: ATP-dependent DNA helicase RecG, partial [Bacteroidota bacterium]|nr:ATP-dependent DNA helicase RecG [Bacteroidota bacterium]